MDKAQEFSIWQSIVTQSDTGQSLLLGGSCSKLANDTWTLQKQWNVNSSQLSDDYNIDSQCYYQWVESFEKRCKQNNWISRSKLNEFIGNAFKDQTLSTPHSISLFGFDELTPKHTRLFEILEQLDSSIKNFEYAEEKHAAIQRITSVSNLDEEITTAANWANSILKTNEDASIAVIFPELTQNRSLIVQKFIELISPDKLRIDQDLHPLPFMISGGFALSSIPVIKILESINQFAYQRIGIEELCALIQSRYIAGYQAEFDRRINFCKYLRNLKKADFSAQNIIFHLEKYTTRLAEQFDINPLPILSQIFKQHKEITDKQKTGKKHPVAWLETFQQQLKTFNWPGETNLNSETFQAVDQIKSVFLQYQQLDLCTGKIAVNEALQYFSHILRDTIFQAETQNDDFKGIHILGSLEAAGLAFTHCWVAGMDDENWPSKAKPNPFIPKSLQLKLNMPHSSPERELLFCEKMTKRYLSNSEVIIFSYCENDADREMSASYLLESVPYLAIDDLLKEFGMEPAPQTHTLCQSNQTLEVFTDNLIPFISENEKVKGGQKVLQNQSRCPFSAFAMHRLKLKKIEEETSGISPLDRGILLHEMMELIWTNLKDQDGLLKMDLDAIEQLIQVSALTLKQSNKIFVSSVLFEIEIERVTPIIQDWLALEKTRLPFKVLALEAPISLQFDNLKIDLRIDRIDQLEDGSLVLIDYKSGECNPNSWQTPRIDEPQIPLYAINYLDKKLSGLIFSQLRSNDTQAKGITENKGIMKGLKQMDDKRLRGFEGSIEAQISAWKDDITLLSNEFSRGLIEVSPKNRTQSCQHCEFPRLCRINEIEASSI